MTETEHCVRKSVKCHCSFHKQTSWWTSTWWGPRSWKVTVHVDLISIVLLRALVRKSDRRGRVSSKCATLEFKMKTKKRQVKRPSWNDLLKYTFITSCSQPKSSIFQVHPRLIRASLVLLKLDHLSSNVLDSTSNCSPCLKTQVTLDLSVQFERLAERCEWTDTTPLRELK